MRGMYLSGQCRTVGAKLSLAVLTVVIERQKMGLALFFTFDLGQFHGFHGIGQIIKEILAIDKMFLL